MSRRTKDPAGNFNYNLNRTQAGMPNTTGMSIKEIGVLIIIVIVIFIVYSNYNSHLKEQGY
ncbi:DUF6366 family protein [Solibacillus silvestris]